ncbi:MULTISPECIES: NtaA/DmoA family FMN-dependent monooxygenase [unclassified Brevibacterium]|uniref:NtaA/DmoA family FMN-dependent monooxygenase n=1 Tax=unclassified Brevibacterium TaxID=2614124 RepID=UPI001E4E6F07|nr:MULTISPECIES: NtaA/DmoA family FMN-dependent monooxygenase [unclassified Brevibacterium]MCD1286626.1 F420-dependent methylene-tetrahydromethanopterin reductase [Brevibacterium sp. CCUG 69071]MDK8434143.1 NtaA/DmoA family FMN-dependent monooxygenase [Brevibacterium sp. H-BE7]
MLEQPLLPSGTPLRQVHLAAHFPGVNNTTVWSDPASGSHIEFDSFAHLARTAEAGLFDFFFLAEGLRLREHQGQIFDLDVVGRPNTTAVLSALASVTNHIGLAGTLSATFNEPFDIARRLASIDLLSSGRAAWNVVTTSNAFTGANFRRGGFLDYADRYHRAEDFIDVARELWDSADRDRQFSHRSDFFDISGRFDLPELPSGHPVIFQAGDSDSGRDFATGSADVIFTRHADPESGRKFYADVKSRLARYGRAEDDLKIFPGISVILGDTPAEAEERSREVAFQQNSEAGAIAFLERVWDRDLSGFDPNGPLPDVPPAGESISQGRVKHVKDAEATIAEWRALAEAENLTARELVVRVSARHSFVGTPTQVAHDLAEAVATKAADGYILVPHLTPGGLDDFVAKVVPELQELGVYRTEYPGENLRENLGLPAARTAVDWTAARHRARGTEPGTTSASESATATTTDHRRITELKEVG